MASSLGCLGSSPSRSRRPPAVRPSPPATLPALRHFHVDGYVLGKYGPDFLQKVMQATTNLTSLAFTDSGCSSVHLILTIKAAPHKGITSLTLVSAAVQDWYNKWSRAPPSNHDRLWAAIRNLSSTTPPHTPSLLSLTLSTNLVPLAPITRTLPPSLRRFELFTAKGVAGDEPRKIPVGDILLPILAGATQFEHLVCRLGSGRLRLRRGV